MSKAKPKTPLEELKTNLYGTKCARFNADERLRGQHRLTNYTLMLLAVYIVALSIGSAYKVQFLIVEHSEFWSVVLSVALLGVAALEAGNNREVKALKLHDNALRIAELYRKVRTLNPENYTRDELNAYSDEYAKLLRECEYNHCKIDKVKFDWTDKWGSFSERILSFLYWVFLWLHHFGVYYSAIILPPIIILFFKPH